MATLKSICEAAEVTSIDKDSTDIFVEIGGSLRRYPIASLMDNIDNSYILDLGEQASFEDGSSTAATSSVINNPLVTIIRFTVSEQSAVIIQQYDKSRTMQYVYWDKKHYNRYIDHTESAVTSVSSWKQDSIDHIYYDPNTRIIYQRNRWNDVVTGGSSSTLPIATTTNAGLMSSAQLQTLNSAQQKPIRIGPFHVAEVISGGSSRIKSTFTGYGATMEVIYEALNSSLQPDIFIYNKTTSDTTTTLYHYKPIYMSISYSSTEGYTLTIIEYYGAIKKFVVKQTIDDVWSVTVETA